MKSTNMLLPFLRPTVEMRKCLSLIVTLMRANWKCILSMYVVSNHVPNIVMYVCIINTSLGTMFDER